MAERSKALRSGRSPLLWAWVRIPLLTSVFEKLRKRSIEKETLLYRLGRFHHAGFYWDFLGYNFKDSSYIKLIHIRPIKKTSSEHYGFYFL